MHSKSKQNRSEQIERGVPALPPTEPSLQGCIPTPTCCFYVLIPNSMDFGAVCKSSRNVWWRAYLCWGRCRSCAKRTTQGAAMSGWPASLMRGWLSDLCSQCGGGWCTAMLWRQAIACLVNQRSNHPFRMGRGVTDCSACLHWRIESVRARWRVWVPIRAYHARMFGCKSIGFMRVLGVCSLWWERLLVGYLARSLAGCLSMLAFVVLKLNLTYCDRWPKRTQYWWQSVYFDGRSHAVQLL